MNNEIALAVVIISLVALILIGGITIAFFIIARQRNEKRLALMNAKLAYEKELRTIETEVEKDLMNHLSLELHDNLGHLITLMRLEYENKTYADDELKARLSTINEYIHQISSEVRMLSRSLSDDYLKSVRLDKAMRMALDRIKQSSELEMEIEINYDQSLNSDQELIAFRIFQEALTNVIRHAKASRLKVQLSSEQGVAIEISDNGKGFDQHKLDGKKNGLMNMKRRAEMAGMKLAITSEKNMGTTIKLLHHGQTENRAGG